MCRKDSNLHSEQCFKEKIAFFFVCLGFEYLYGTGRERLRGIRKKFLLPLYVCMYADSYVCIHVGAEGTVTGESVPHSSPISRCAKRHGVLSHLPSLLRAESVTHSSSRVPCLSSLTSPKKKDLLSPEPVLLEKGNTRVNVHYCIFFIFLGRNDSTAKNYPLCLWPSFP